MNDDNKLVYAGREPELDELRSAYLRCSPWGDGDWNRVLTNEETRFCRWAGQTADGKKHSTPAAAAFPFENASDCRCPLADAIINELVAVSVNAFWRAMIRPKAGQSEASNYAVKLVEYFVHTVLTQDLMREVELSEQYRQTTGWVILHPSWEREIALENVTVELAQLVQLAERMAPEFPDHPLAQLPALILDPTLEEPAAEALALLYEHYARAQVQQIVEIELPPLTPARLRRAVRDLRTEGEAELPLPRVVKNQPCLCALKPWIEVFIPPETTDLQAGGPVFRREWLTEVQLRARARLEDWNEDWVEAVVKLKGQFSHWLPANAGTFLTGTWQTTTQPLSEHLEVVWACYKLLDGDNVPGVYYTLFHPGRTKADDGAALYGAHGLLDYARGRLPYVAGSRENWCRQIVSARGVPEITSTWQREVKVQRDGLVDLTSIAVFPPLHVYATGGALQTKYKYGPGVENTVMPGREPRFLEVPKSGAPVAFELMEQIEQDVDNYFGRLSEKVAPPRQQAKLQMHVNGFLLLWSQALQQMIALAQQYLPDAEFAQATGAPQGWLEQRRAQPGLLYAELAFDVRELDPEYVMQQMEVIQKAIVPTDVAGVIDRAKFTRLQLRAINPNLARELVADNQAASQRMFTEVQTAIALMRLGNEAQYVENDPSAAQKLQFATQIIGANPDYQQALQQGGRFGELLQKWAENLQFSLTQENNKQIGPIGVVPDAMEQ